MLPLPFVLFIYDFLSSKEVGSIAFTKPKDIAMVCSFKPNRRPTWQTQTFLLLSWVPEEEQCFLMASHECLSFVEEFQWLMLTMQRSNRQENCGFEKLSQDLCYFLRSFSSLTLFFKDNIRTIGCSDWWKTACCIIFCLTFKYFLTY